MSDIRAVADQISAIPTGTVGIKETLDLINMMDVYLDTYEKAMADNKLDLDDLQYATTAIMASVEAFKGADQIPTELGELDAVEATTIFQKMFTLIQRLIKVISKKEVSVPVVFPVGN